jgi:hypothetical protein
LGDLRFSIVFFRDIEAVKNKKKFLISNINSAVPKGFIHAMPNEDFMKLVFGKE